jgi:hypothetical protein
MSTQVTLYIATHNVTGKKYFGKTTKIFDIQTLQESYHGSGSYWLNHLKIHGDNVTMEIYGIYKIEEVEKHALKFSKENDIVESKDWANLKEENGLDGTPKGHKFSNTENMGNKKGSVLSEEHKRKIGEASKGRSYSDERNDKISNALKGRVRSKEHCESLSKALTGRTLEEDTKNKISESLKGRTFSEEHKRKISEASKRSKHSEETKKRLSIIAKNRAKIKCPHCDKEGDAANMKRWHFDNCKFK